MREARELRIRSVDAALKQLRAISLWQFAGLALCIGVIAYPSLGQITTTVVQDTVYHADGTVATGTILVTWPAFVTATGNTVAAGSLSAKISPVGCDDRGAHCSCDCDRTSVDDWILRHREVSAVTAFVVPGVYPTIASYKRSHTQAIAGAMAIHYVLNCFLLARRVVRCG